MKPSYRGSVLAGALMAIAASGFIVASTLHAQSPHDAHSTMRAMQGHDPGQMGAMQGHHQGDMGAMHQHFAATENDLPIMPGQDAFGAVQEIVRMLDADPTTDWSKVNLEALRQHLIDMNDVTLNAAAAPKPVEGGIQVAVTGTGRTVAAIQRMVPAHAHEIAQTHLNGWDATTEPLPDGVLLTVTSTDPKQVEHIRGLGFIGIMVSGSHHQAHHLAMARGEMMH